MFIQVEITTHCNFNCFYCVGRDMPQQHMAMERFDEIVSKLPRGQYPVSLQGEGEPMTHPQFWDMVERVKSVGKIPYTITNGSLIDSRRVAQCFPEIGFSLDTIDPEEAQRLGRYKLNRVLENLEQLIESIGALRIIVHTVDYGQPLSRLREYLQNRGLLKHIVQPLQSKSDYRRRYLERASATQNWRYHYRCRYILQPVMRFFTINGVEMPCCFIKDLSKYVSVDEIKWRLLHRQVPATCGGCREIMEK